MCEPISATIAAAAMVSSVALQTYGAYKGAKAKGKAADIQAQRERDNQDIANRKAGELEEAGEDAAEDYRVKVGQLVGSQRAAFSASGVDVDSGSALDLQAESMAFGEMDAMTIAANAEAEAEDMREKGKQFGEQADITAASKPSVGLATATTLLGGVSQLASAGTSLVAANRPTRVKKIG